MSAPYSVIIPAHNQLECCTQCVQSLILAARGPFKLILVDNGSTDGVGAYFDSVPGATVVHTGRNLGFAAGTNAGLAHVEGHALLLNSDTIIPNGALDALVSVLDRDPAIGLVGPRTNCASGAQQIDGLHFDTLDTINAFAEARAIAHAGALSDVARLVGFCLLIRDAVLAELGPLDDAYGIGNFEDDDYCIRALRAGHRLCIAEDTFVFHYGSRTFAAMGLVDDAWRGLLAQNEATFNAKWAPRPEERSDAAQAARQLRREARAAAQRGEHTDALRLLRDALAAHPSNPDTYAELGHLLHTLGDPARAREQFQRALALDSAHPAARAALGTDK